MFNVESTKRIGLIVFGVGKGHLTQANTMYKILTRKIQRDVPIVIIFSNDEDCTDLAEYAFSKAPIKIVRIKSSADTVHNVTKLLLHSIYYLFFTTKAIFDEMEDIYGVQIWMNFFAPVRQTRRTCIHISHQVNLDSILVDLAMLFISGTFVSLHHPCKRAKVKHTISTLIDEEKIDRIDSRSKLIICYAVSGDDLFEMLCNIARNHKDFHFVYFSPKKPDLTLDNVAWFKPNFNHFREHLKRCLAVLCTSGNQLIQECVLNKIPCAIIPAHRNHFEQRRNFEEYISRGWATELNSNLNIGQLCIDHIRVCKAYKEIQDMLLDREQIIANILTDSISKNSSLSQKHFSTRFIFQLMGLWVLLLTVISIFFFIYNYL